MWAAISLAMAIGDSNCGSSAVKKTVSANSDTTRPKSARRDTPLLPGAPITTETLPSGY